MRPVPDLPSIHSCLFRRSVTAHESIQGVEPLEPTRPSSYHIPRSGKKRGVDP